MSSERLYATGRRKTSSARIYLSQGDGAITVNNKDLVVGLGKWFDWKRFELTKYLLKFFGGLK